MYQPRHRSSRISASASASGWGAPTETPQNREWAQTVKGEKRGEQQYAEQSGGGSVCTAVTYLPRTTFALCPPPSPPACAPPLLAKPRRPVTPVCRCVALAPVCRCVHRPTTKTSGGGGIFRQDSVLEGVLVCHPAEGQHVPVVTVCMKRCFVCSRASCKIAHGSGLTDHREALAGSI